MVSVKFGKGERSIYNCEFNSLVEAIEWLGKWCVVWEVRRSNMIILEVKETRGLLRKGFMGTLRIGS